MSNVPEHIVIALWKISSTKLLDITPVSHVKLETNNKFLRLQKNIKTFHLTFSKLKENTEFYQKEIRYLPVKW